MNPKLLAAGLLLVGCLAAAGGGAYLAVRQNTPPQPADTASAPASAVPAGSRPVAETEAVVGKPAESKTPEAPAVTPEAPASSRTAESPARSDARRKPALPVKPPASQTAAARPAAPGSPAQKPAPAPERTTEPAAVPPPPEPVSEPVRPVEPPPPPVPQFEEVIVPASAVIGLQVETPLSSERAHVEDRVDARVTRDVSANGHVAIPQGSRVIGSVTFVDKGGKVKSAARLGVRFHTLVLADGREIPLRTEPFFRDGESPAGDSARKIGGAAVGGAILGAIVGGGKGAAIGSGVGAAGGTAAVMAGDRNAAVLAAGTIVTVRLSAPVTVEVEKRH
jgi:type F conjugative transfer system protein TrbI